MDLESLKEIEQRHRPLFVVPLANKKYLSKFSNTIQIQELDWWQEINHKNLKITLVPAQHWSSRNLFDRRKALWGGFVLTYPNKKVLFTGDTGYNEILFKEINSRLGDMDLSFIPIGAYEPRWFMKNVHNNPEEAIYMHQDLKSKNSIAMHFGTFQISDESFDQPVKDLKAAKEKLGVSNFHILEVGETRKF